MVLIIRNNRIQSRRNTRLKRLLSRVVPAYRENNIAKNRRVTEERENVVGRAMTLVAVMGTLFLYSAAMFTLPFAAFYGVRHIVTKYDTDRFTTNCISVLAAVVTVNVIIGCYAYKALTEPDDTEGSDDRGADDPSDPQSREKTD